MLRCSRAGGSARARWKALILSSCASLLLTGAAHAEDSREFWPELQGFIRRTPNTRIILDAAYARGKESDALALDLAAYLDISVRPIRRRYRGEEDWQRTRYAWFRIGYDHVLKSTEGVQSPSEDRGILSFLHKTGLPGEIWLEARERADLRWIAGDYSTRYRFRLEATREFKLLDRTVVPYFNVEWFYDTRYDGWARTLYQAGPEVTLSEHFRFEVYLARQVDDLPSASTLNAFGFVAKWYY
jgi:hypothetical protein